MIVEVGDYTLKPDKLVLFIDSRRAHGLTIELDCLGTLQSDLTRETGELDHLVVWWSHETSEHHQVSPPEDVGQPALAGLSRQITDLIHPPWLSAVELSAAPGTPSTGAAAFP